VTARVYHAELWGQREGKYQWLSANDVQSVRWTALKPNSPFYFFVPKDETLRAEYESCPKVTDVFAQNVTGIVTARDDFVIDFEDEPLLDRMYALRDSRVSDSDIRADYFAGRGSKKYPPGDSRGWKLPNARKTVQQDADWKSRCADILYRPFDVRRIYYAPWIVDWPRLDLIPTMLCNNLGLAVGRQGQVIGSKTWDIVFCSRAMTEFNFYRRGGNNLFPLYLYPGKVKGYGAAGGWPAGKDGRRPNLTPDFVETFAAKLGLEFEPDGQGDAKKTFGPEDVFHYAYAVFGCPTYRTRYAEFLKVDFPRLPVTSDKALFAKLVRLGRELAALHLLESVPAPAARYPRQGDNVVARVDYKPPTSESPGRVSINGRQYFDNVPPEVWEFHVGGYQVCQKWLKDRKGRPLSYDDIEHYRRITEAVRQTLRLMGEIDRTLPSWPLT